MTPAPGPSPVEGRTTTDLNQTCDRNPTALTLKFNFTKLASFRFKKKKRINEKFLLDGTKVSSVPGRTSSLGAVVLEWQLQKKKSKNKADSAGCSTYGSSKTGPP